ncbi:MAG: hypothetical protein SYNGOMJ08_00305 [Candidatus Syntrophoarchaeum sp. GoM_oil]|nr:MAG: hypothetical protein SYNGOMJ08_00305 [Candidatus Syntrophoarchaeum sp. GoM_oil]
MIWNPKIELMPRKDLESLQLKNLRSQIDYIYSNSLFHQRRFDENGIKPGDIKEIKDLEKIPLISRGELQDAARNGDFYGDRLCVPESDAIMTFAPPEDFFYPQEDIAVVAAVTPDDQAKVVEHLTRDWMMMGISPGNLVQVLCWAYEALGFAFTNPSHNLMTPSVGKILGCRVIPLELFAPDAARTIFMGLFFKPDAIVTSETSLMTLESYLMPDAEGNVTVKVMISETGEWTVMEDEQISPKGMGYERIILRSPIYEQMVMTEGRRRELSKMWGAEIYSLLDIQDNLLYAAECEARKGLHVWEDAFVVEIVDGDGKQVNDGEAGKLVVTNLFAKATPMIRYNTEITASLTKEVCSCGRTHARILLS